MSNKFEVTMANGEKLLISGEQYWDRNGTFQDRLGRIDGFVRVGEFDLACGSNNFAVSISPNKAGWTPVTESVGMRSTRMIDSLPVIFKALAIFKEHPLADKVREEAIKELDAWNPSAVERLLVMKFTMKRHDFSKD